MRVDCEWSIVLKTHAFLRGKFRESGHIIAEDANRVWHVERIQNFTPEPFSNANHSLAQRGRTRATQYSAHAARSRMSCQRRRGDAPIMLAVLRKEFDVCQPLEIKPQLLMPRKLVVAFGIGFSIARMKLLDGLTKLLPRTFAACR